MEDLNENNIIIEENKQNQNEDNIIDNEDELFERICHIQKLIKKESAINSLCNSIIKLFYTILYS